MAGGCWRRWWSAIVAFLVATGAEAQFSRLNPGSTCADYSIDSVSSETQCFSVAAPALGLGDKSTITLDGLGFTGCLYNSEADLIMYGVSTDSGVTLTSWEYICDGVASTTTTTTTTVTTMTTTTVTGPVGSGYSLIELGETCADYKISDVLNASECFDEARPYVGLGDSSTLDLNGLGFTGCVFNVDNNYVFFSSSSGGDGAVANIKYLCRGIATTTTTTTSSTTLTTTTSTATTVTETTSTTTATTSTTTVSTVTETTTTSTTSTRTSSTSTITTTTYTGSSSTTTSTTVSTTSSTGTTSTTTTTLTFTTSTTSTVTMTTSTVTTMTFTGGEGGAGFVGDDPLTLFGGVMHKFWLPDGQLVPLVRTRELQLLGAASTHRGEQWIDRLVVLGPLDEAVLRVQTRDDIASFKAGTVPPDAFETLNITLDYLGGLSMESIPPPEAYAYQWGSVIFAFGRVPNFKIGEAQAEMLVIEGASARIVVMAVAAGGFSAEEAHLAAKFAHLDFVLHVKEQDTCEGVLPELWGLRPLSNGTQAMLDIVS